MYSLRFVVFGTVLYFSYSQPSLDQLTSIYQPNDQPNYGAASVTNAWGSLLVSTQNILGINAIEMAPFSSGWQSTNLYGWDIDTTSLYINDNNVQPDYTLWTPYSVIRNGSTTVGTNNVVLNINTEVRMVFEGQGILFEANISSSTTAATLINISTDFRLPLRYYPRGDMCSSWHYPTHSEPCCFNWFPSEPDPDQNTNEYFVPSWYSCSTANYATFVSSDQLSPAVSAVSFPNACSSSSSSSSRTETVTITDLAAPTYTDGTIGYWTNQVIDSNTVLRLRVVLLFSNISDPRPNIAAVRSVADQFDTVWMDAKNDWQTRFNAVFDSSHSHFSGHLPILSLTSVASSNTINNPTVPSRSRKDFDFSFQTNSTLAEMEFIYYSSIISLLANERTNMPPSLPSNPPPCPINLTVSPVVDHEISTVSSMWPTNSFVATLAGSSASTMDAHHYRSGLDRYMRSVVIGYTDDNNNIPRYGYPRLTGSSFSGGPDQSSADYQGGKYRSQLLDQAISGRSSAHVSATELLQEMGAPWRMFITGGGLNTSTNIFYWDNEYLAQLHMLLEPDTMARQILTWISSVDEFGVPSYWSFWGYDLMAQRGIGNYYSANDFTLNELINAYIRTTNNYSFLNITVSVPYPNGTVTHPRVYDISMAMTQHWKGMNVSNCLADYGLAPNLLECVPTYIHRVAGVNAGNVWMSNVFSDIAEIWANDSALATQLRNDADCIANDVLNTLYLPSTGYFAAQMLNNTLISVPHVMDHVYATLYMGVQRGSSPTRNQYIPSWMANEMGTFVEEQLLVPYWMRALSLNYSINVSRSDHGNHGAYSGWPALTIRSMGERSDYMGAMKFLNDTYFSATLGPYGQAIEVQPPLLPYKPMVFTLYNAMCGGSFADTIIRSIFGFAPVQLPLSTTMAYLHQKERAVHDIPFPLIDANITRGFTGILSGITYLGHEYDIISDIENGLQFIPH